jgi:hypothetical protein
MLVNLKACVVTTHNFFNTYSVTVALPFLSGVDSAFGVITEIKQSPRGGSLSLEKRLLQ